MKSGIYFFADRSAKAEKLEQKRISRERKRRLRRERSGSWPVYWQALLSATVENTAPTHVILTFGQPNISLVASDFTVTSKVVDSLSRNPANTILTLTLHTAVVKTDSLTVTLTKAGGLTHSVINNVL